MKPQHPLRVVYDHQIFCTQAAGGISRYFCELIAHFGRGGAVEPVLPFRYATNRYMAQLPKPWRRTGLPKQWRFKGRDRLECWLIDRRAKRPVANCLQRRQYDVYHPTFFAPDFLPHCGGRPFVLTFYDIIAERFGHDPRRDPQVIWKPRMIAAATRIIAISHHTKRDLVEYYGVDPERVDVVHLAGSLGDLQPELLPLGTPFLLFVGQRFRYKNFDRFTEAVAPLLGPQLHLICAGGGRFDAEETVKLQALGIAAQVRQMDVSDRQLAHLYRKARALVFPSHYEGFGLPVLEAMSCGCPVVASNTSSLPEVGGSAALYFDPMATEDMRQVIRSLLEDDALRADRRAKGEERAKEFSWARCAEATAGVYARAVEEWQEANPAGTAA